MPIKTKIKTAAQFVLLFGSSLSGFMFIFTAVWLSFGLSYVGWVSFLLAAVATTGLFTWILRG